MAKASGTTKTVSSANAASSRTLNSNTSELKKMISSVTATIDEDVLSLKVNDKGAVAKLNAKVINESLDSIADAVNNIVNVKSAIDVEQQTVNVYKAAKKAADTIQEKIDILEHNNQLNKGVAKNTYNKAINGLKDVKYEIKQKFIKKDYKIEELANIQGYFMKMKKYK